MLKFFHGDVVSMWVFIVGMSFAVFMNWYMWYRHKQHLKAQREAWERIQAILEEGKNHATQVNALLYRESRKPEDL